MKKTTHVSIALLTLVLLLSQCHQPDEEVAASNTQAQSMTNSTDLDPLDLPAAGRVNGEYMKAFLVAHESFRKDPAISEEKKQIKNYTIEFRQRGDVYFVLFTAKRKSSERELDGGESELGKDVMYTIRKTDYEIIRKNFFK